MSIIQVDKNKYRIFVSDGFNLDGSRRRLSKTITTDLTGRDLKRFLVEAEFDFEDEVKSSNASYNDMSNGSFSNFVLWWKDYVDLTPQTLESYVYNLNFIEKHIGHKKLCDINKADMLEMLDIVRIKKNIHTGEPISPRTVRNYMNILKSVFSTAVELEIIKHNPLDNVKYTVKDYQIEDNYYNVEEMNEMIIALEEEPVVYKLAILFTLATGVRIGELLAIHQSDLDRARHRVTISKSISETRGKRELGETKTKKTRVEFYPKELETLIDKHLRSEKVRKEILGVENDLLFTSSKGELFPKRTLQDWFKRFIKRHNLRPITYHGLRHTSATILLAKGIPLKNVADRLGHSRPSTTSDIYAHAIPKFDKDASNIFSDILSSGTKSGTKKEEIRLIK